MFRNDQNAQHQLAAGCTAPPSRASGFARQPQAVSVCLVPGAALGSWIKVVASLPGQERQRDVRPDLSWAARWRARGARERLTVPSVPVLF